MPVSADFGFQLPRRERDREGDEQVVELVGEGGGGIDVYS
jgi:hypothetical protein